MISIVGVLFSVSICLGSSADSLWGNEVDWPGCCSDEPECEEEPCEPCECDLNEDGSCDGKDWLIFYPDWGSNHCNEPVVK